MNNKHQELIAEKVAEFLRMGDLDRDKGGWHVPYEGVWTEDQKSWLIQTLQDTINKVLEEESERCRLIAWEYTIEAMKKERALVIELRAALTPIKTGDNASTK